MSKKGYSQPDAFGGYTHYDGNGKKTGAVNRVSLASISITTPAAAAQATVIPVSSAATTTTKTPAVAMLPLASTDHTIVPKCGLCADSVTTSWPNMLSDVCLSVPITP